MEEEIEKLTGEELFTYYENNATVILNGGIFLGEEQKKEIRKNYIAQRKEIIRRISKNNIEEFKKKLIEEIDKLWVTSLLGVSGINKEDGQKEFLEKHIILDLIKNI